MSATFGSKIKISIFGESHGEGIGVVVDGLPAGLEIDQNEIELDANRRAPGNDKAATPRKESDKAEFLSGLLNGITTGAPICAIIRNTNIRSQDYGEMSALARPSHADYTGFVRFNGFNDIRGGGHFSGRITAPLVTAGSLCRAYLKSKGIEIGAHIFSVGGIYDIPFDSCHINSQQLSYLRAQKFPLLDECVESEMRGAIEGARLCGDSVGGIIECAAIGINAGFGEPFFDSVESVISHLVFSIPGVKGVEFGAGFSIAHMYGSQANDSFIINANKVSTLTNNSGGINGGITNGMPLIIRAAMRPTPSISIEQDTIDYKKMENAKLSVRGRHDPCIVLRAVPVVESAVMIALSQLI